MEHHTVESDLFALRSTLYELVAGKAPYDGRSPESIENLFRKGVFPGVDGLPLGDLIRGCWVKKFRSAKEMLKFGERVLRVARWDTNLAEAGICQHLPAETFENRS
jgi:hypothetical protein